jgi:hypothetical protein
MPYVKNTQDYQVNFIDNTSVEITGVRDVIQKYGFLEFRAPGDQFQRGSDLPLIIAFRADQIYSYEPVKFELKQPTVSTVSMKRKYTKRTR